jgi:ParB family chromosome partitioning protein
MSQAYELVAIDRVVESPLNPRRHYNQKRLEELAESIRQAGIISPLIVRGRDANFEIAAGHRRRRAAIIAGLTEVPVMIRPMDDASFLEVLNVDNLQRVDVHPLEEADGFAHMLTTLPDFNVATLALRTGKGETYLYQRLALRGLIEPLQKLFVEERINISQAILLARLQPADQERLSRIDEKNPWDSGALWDPDRSERGQPPVPVSTAELKKTIEAEVYLDLKGTPWNKLDAELVPAAGACMTCPKRTKANLALFDDVEKGDRCLDRACYDSKRDAHLVQVETKLEAKGTELPKISLGHHGGEVPKGVKQVHSYEVRDKGDKDARPTEKALVVAGPRRGEVVEVFVRKECGLNLDDPAEMRKRAAEEAKRKLDAKAKWKGRQLAWTMATASKSIKLDDTRLLSMIIGKFANNATTQLLEGFGLKVENGSDRRKLLADWASEVTRTQTQLAQMLVGIAIDELLGEWLHEEGAGYKETLALLAYLNVDMKACVKTAREQLAQKAGHKGEPTKATKKPAKAAKKKGKN